MKIRLVGFKCYGKSEFRFRKEGLLLLKGPSGAGKSTLLQAISWALFGGIRGIDSLQAKKGKLSVELRFSVRGKKWKVFRQKRPTLLQVTNGDRTETDAAGQAWISELLGTPSLWKMACFLEQGSRNLLLHVSNQERMHTLYQIAFSESDPEKFLTKIDEKFQESKIQFLTLQSSLEDECKAFAAFLQTQGIRMADAQSEEEIHQHETELALEEAEISRLLQKQQEQERELHYLKACEEHLEQLECKLRSLPPLLSDLALSEKRHELTLLREQFHAFQRVQEISEKIGDLEKQEALYAAVAPQSEAAMAAWKEQETKVRENTEKVRRLGLSYDRSSMEKALSESQKQLHLQPLLSIRKHIQELERQEASLPRFEPVSEETLPHLQEEKFRMEQRQNVLTCPHCSRSVRWVEGALIPSTDDPWDRAAWEELQRKIEQEKKKIDIQNERHTLLQQKERWEKSFCDMGGKKEDFERGEGIHNLPNLPILSREETEMLRRKISVLSSIPFIEPPVLSWDEMKKGEEKRKWGEWKAFWEKEREKLSGSYSFLRNTESTSLFEWIPEKEREIREQEGAQKLCSEWEQQCRDFREKRDRIRGRLESGISERLEFLQKQWKEKSEALVRARQTFQAIRQREALAEKRARVVALSARVYALDRLKQTAIQVESQVLQDLVEGINATLEDLVEKVFDVPLQIRLKLTKETKTTFRLKPWVHLNLRYQGQVYDSISQLSGGEGDRVSLLLTLAFHRFSPCPFLLLDETFSSLDGTLKEQCLNAIRSVTSGKSVLCVDHEGVEGYYDEVYTIGTEQWNREDFEEQGK